MSGPLTRGEWNALLHLAGADVRPMILRLAVLHGAIEPPEPAECPLCRTRRREPEQTALELSE